MAGDEDQRERRFCRLYEANFRPVQGEVINYTVYAASGVVNSIGAVPSPAA